MPYGLGAAWSGAGIVMAVVTRFAADAPFPLVFGVFGFVAGVVFSVLLALAEGRRRFDQMSLRRFAGWGAMGGLLLSAVFAMATSLGWGEVLAVAPTFAVACAVCAYGSLAVARRAVREELPDSRDDATGAELDHQEKRKLRGTADSGRRPAGDPRA